MSLLKLKDIEKPTIELELEDGTVKSYDLWELAERYNVLESDLAAKESDDPAFVRLPAFYDGVRAMFGFPPTAEAEKSATFTLTRGMCEHLRTAVVEELTKRPERQRFFDLLRGSSGSTASSPAK